MPHKSPIVASPDNHAAGITILLARLAPSVLTQLFIIGPISFMEELVGYHSQSANL
jgi:hypothetical protein